VENPERCYRSGAHRDLHRPLGGVGNFDVVLSDIDSKEMEDQTLVAGPFTADDESSDLGSLRLIDFPDFPAVEKHIAEESYVIGGIQKRWVVNRWRAALPTTWRDCPRTAATSRLCSMAWTAPMALESARNTATPTGPIWQNMPIPSSPVAPFSTKRTRARSAAYFFWTFPTWIQRGSWWPTNPTAGPDAFRTSPSTAGASGGYSIGSRFNCRGATPSPD